MAPVLIDHVLARYPGVSKESLNFPPDSTNWSEHDLDLFVGSGGFIKPKKKKQEDAPIVVPTPATQTPEQGVTDLARSIGVSWDSLQPLRSSAWWVNNPNARAKIRLFCAMGIGNVASTFGPWISPDRADAYPDIEACVVEFPGHGTNFEEPLGSLDAAADALIEQIRACHFDEQGTPRPYALFGFSMGANIAYRVATKLGGCAKLYLAGRGPPHFCAPACDELSPEMVRVEELLQESNMEALVEALLESVLPVFMAPAQLKSYSRIMQSRLAREQGRQEIRRFAASLVSDCKIGMQANTVDRDFAGDIDFYWSPADETWPTEVEFMYDDFSGLWEKYTSGTFNSIEVDSVSHDELGGFNSPVFDLICQDLSRVVASGKA